MNSKKQKEPNLLLEIENPPRFVEISDVDGIFFNPKFTEERRVRAYIYDMLKAAHEKLPQGYNFVVYEALRTLEKQIELWNEVTVKMQKEFPDMDINSEEFIAKCNVYAANPYRRGSGHQSGAAIDITISDENGNELDMGSFVRDFSKNASANAPNLSETAIANRALLNDVLSSVGFINYPSEWWHYSFGDRLWARLTHSEIAFFKSVEF